jgi:replicative DNA helicase
VSGHFGQSSDLPIDPWLLGSLLANGTMTSAKTQICSGHEWVHEQVAACAGAHRTTATRRPDRYLSVIKGEDHGVNPILIALRSLGLTGIRSEDKFIPRSYLEASREDRRRLLTGLIDGDGWVEKFGAMRYATSSRRLADDIMSLVRSLGGWVSDSVKQPTFTHKGEKRQGLPSFVLNIVLDKPEDYVSVPVKRERVAQTGRHKRLNIMSVEPSRVTQSQCITVTHPSRLYVTNDYIVTHNSALAAGIAHSVAKSGTPAAIFSLEMSDEELYGRLLSERAGVSSERLRRGKVEPSNWPALEEAAQALKDVPLEIDQTGGLTIGQLATRARRMHREKKLGLIVVDYLQLMAGSGARRSDNRTQEITEITQGLKALAKELNLPVIALSQLSRAVENRDDKRPQLSDLRESGSIEQDADVVIFVYREEYYLEGQEPPFTEYDRHADWRNRMQNAAGTAEAIVGKARHGPTGTVKLAFAKELTRFSDLAREGHND